MSTIEAVWADTVLSGEEYAELAAAIDEMVGHAYGEDPARRFLDDPRFGAASWQQLGSQYTMLGLHLPVALGGQGQPYQCTALLVSALGKRLAPSPHLGTLAAITLLAHGGSEEQQARWLPGLLAGTSSAGVVGIASGLEPGKTDQPGIATGGEDLIFGVDADGVQIYAATEVTATGRVTLDLTRPRADIEVTGHGERLGGAGADVSVVTRTLVEATLNLAVDSVAGARVCLDRTVEYAQLRSQFGRPIGSFQAVKHRLADLFGEVSAAEGVVAEAVAEYSHNPTGPVRDATEHAVRVAAVAASEAYSLAGKEFIHLHGGIGFTYEHDAHLYYRRALADRSLFGTPSQHRRSLAQSLPGPAQTPSNERQIS